MDIINKSTQFAKDYVLPTAAGLISAIQFPSWLVASDLSVGVAATALGLHGTIESCKRAFYDTNRPKHIYKTVLYATTTLMGVARIYNVYQSLTDKIDELSTENRLLTNRMSVLKCK